VNKVGAIDYSHYKKQFQEAIYSGAIGERQNKRFPNEGQQLSMMTIEEFNSSIEPFSAGLQLLSPAQPLPLFAALLR
jgi:hypothetical protein